MIAAIGVPTIDGTGMAAGMGRASAIGGRGTPISMVAGGIRSPGGCVDRPRLSSFPTKRKPMQTPTTPVVGVFFGASQSL